MINSRVILINLFSFALSYKGNIFKKIYANGSNNNLIKK